MSMMGSFSGIRVVTSESVGEPYEDWSKVRSPGRARRRLAQGHRQCIVTRFRSNGQFYHDRLNNTIFCHPSDYARIANALDV